MKKKEKIYVGNKIKTNAKFKPINQDGTRLDLKGESFEGTVIGKRGKFIFIDFHQELPFTHYLNGLLSKPTGRALFSNETTPIDSCKSKDKQKQDFFNLMIEFRYKELEKIPGKIRSIEDTINNRIGNIKSLSRDIDFHEDEIQKEEFERKKLENKKMFISFNSDYIMKQYNKMKTNPKVDTIKILNINQDTNVLLTTKNLTYKNPNSKIPNYNLGAYKILIPIDADKRLKIINFKKHVQKFYYHHPCINRGEVCLGNAMISEVTKLRNSGNIINLIHLLINFLEEPNYNDPHLSEELFYCNQKVTIKPKNEEDWFNEEYWDKFEKWDGAKYTKDTQIIQQKLREE